MWIQRDCLTKVNILNFQRILFSPVHRQPLRLYWDVMRTDLQNGSKKAERRLKNLNQAKNSFTGGESIGNAKWN